MIRSTFLLAFAAAPLLVMAAPVGASTFSARPVAAVTAKRLVARDISWACGPAACQGATEESRPLVLCQGLAKQVGTLASFIVDGRALAAAELGKCNRAAPTAAAAQLARAR